VVDFTVPDAVTDNARYATRGMHAVIGTSGLAAPDVDELRSWVDRGSANIVYGPDFSLGGR
jgi:dihydrodipicolinate reductase